MVVLDFDGHPQKYDQLEVLRNVVAKEAPPCQILVNRTPAPFFCDRREVNVLKIDIPGEERRGWKRTRSEIDTASMPANWKKRVAEGANFVLQETWVKANDAHYAPPLENREREKHGKRDTRRHEARLRMQKCGLSYTLTGRGASMPKSERALLRATMREIALYAYNLFFGKQRCGSFGSWSV